MIINGDALTVLKRMDSESVHMAITSPPYYGLRKYNTPGIVWGGDINCSHKWGIVHPPGYRESDTNPGALQSDGNKNRENLTSDICSKCGSWKGELGLEPSPEMYILHLTEIFHELKRVLRSDGIFWCNIGDSYARNPAKGDRGEYLGLHKNQIGSGCHKASQHRGMEGYKEKDLIGIPWALAFSLRSDGWYLRADLPWVKHNSMPSSVTDRPCSSIEHIFMFAKSKKYFYDHVATLQPATTNENRPPGVKRSREYNGKINIGLNAPQQFRKQDGTGNPTTTGFNDRYEDNGTGLRFMRDSDFFLKTWQGLIQNGNGEPLALVVNTKGYKGGHFAPFPIRLIEPLILAGTSSHGVCPHCGAPWARQTEKGKFIQQSWGEHPKIQELHGELGATSCFKSGGTQEIITTGWLPSCNCENNVPMPAIVLDPFSGSSATGVACKLHNRNYIGIELNPEYCKLGEQRVRDGK